MTAPVIRQFTGTIPDKGQPQTEFDTNVDAFLDWQALQLAPDLVAFGVFANSTAAALVAANLPPLTGQALDAVRVNAAADGVEFADVTAAGWALLGDADAAAQRTTLGAASIESVESKASKASVASKAPIESPQLTGTPRAPTAGAATNTTQLATTAYTRTAIPNVMNAAGSAPIYACRAWVNFNGTGTVAIRASGNVSSITDNGEGDYTVNFTIAMEDANYAATANWTDGSLYRGEQDGPAKPVTYGVGSVRILLTGGGGTPKDGSIVSVAIFR